MGKADVTRHVKSLGHLKAVKSEEDREQSKITISDAENKVSVGGTANLST